MNAEHRQLMTRAVHHELSRRRLLQLGTAAGAGAALSGIGLTRIAAPGAAAQATPAADGEVIQMVGDVIEYTLEPEDRWDAPVGSVVLKLHPGFFNGGDAWYIRTDASDQAFAEAQQLVYVPLLKNALEAEGSFAHIYLFDGGADGQRAVVSTVPGEDDFTSAYRVHNVSFSGDAELLDSVDAITAAEEAGTVTVEETDTIVNYPIVLWPDGGLPVDDEMVAPLGKGPLVEEPDTENGTVTFKLHKCYPGSRYIVTDTSSEPMAPMMGVAPSAPTQALAEANATAPIYVFGNGLPGTGAMGFQPAIFNAEAGDVIWSPFWDHKTVVWTDEAAAELLTSEAEVMERADAGEVEIFNGVPDSHPNGFVVNCPAPLLAPNDYDPADFSG